MLQTVYLVSLGLGAGWLMIASLLSALGGAEKDIEAAADAGFDADVDAGFDADAHLGFDADVDAGFDADAHLGFDADAETGAPVQDVTGVSWLSPLVVAGTLFGFGITGLGVDTVLGHGLIALPIAGGTGFVSGWSLRKGLSMLRRVEASSHTQRRSTIGTTGEVITSIPEGGVGQVVIISGGQRINAPARSRDGAPISRGARVFISRVDGPTFEVEQAREDRTSTSAGAARAASLNT